MDRIVACPADDLLVRVSEFARCSPDVPDALAIEPTCRELSDLPEIAFEAKLGCDSTCRGAELRVHRSKRRIVGMA